MSSFIRGMFLPPNKFRKANIKVGDIRKIYDPADRSFVMVEVKEISDKGNYNMYICRKLKTGFITTFTDKDLIFEERIKKERGEL